MSALLELVIEDNPLELVIHEENLSLELDSDLIELITVAEQGPPGEDGILTFSQETEPTGGMKEGDIWFNTLTKNMYVYVDDAWVLQGLDDGFF